MALLILSLGVLSITRMATDVFPGINIPVVSVIWSYGGLAPEEMEARVVDDARLHLLGREAAVGPDHADDGDVDPREDIRRHARDAEHPQAEDQQRHHRHRPGPVQGQVNDPPAPLLRM